MLSLVISSWRVFCPRISIKRWLPSWSLKRQLLPPAYWSHKKHKNYHNHNVRRKKSKKLNTFFHLYASRNIETDERRRREIFWPKADPVHISYFSYLALLVDNKKHEIFRTSSSTNHFHLGHGADGENIHCDTNDNRFTWSSNNLSLI